MQDNMWDERMISVKGRLETIVVNLKHLGYQFSSPEGVLPGPDSKVDEKIAFIEDNIGVIPAMLASFYRIVGSVDFAGNHQGWTGCEYPDPLVVFPIDPVLAEAQEFLDLGSREDYWASDTGKFIIPISPDFYHKADVSGGMWYGIEIPNEEDDPKLLEEWHSTTFSDYLRICIRWGGFPGLENASEDHKWPIELLKRGL